MRSVKLGEAVLLVAAEAAALEAKSPVLVHFVTLRAGDIGERRVLKKRSESRRRICAGKKFDFLLAAVPKQGERVHAGADLDHGMKHIGERLLRLDGPAVQFEFPPGSGGDDIGLIGRQRRAVDRTHDLSGIQVGGQEPTGGREEKQGERERGKRQGKLYSHKTMIQRFALTAIKK